MSEEIYIFVDDDKGRCFGNNENVIGMFARSFECFDDHFFPLLTRLLENAEAWDWHASDGNGFHHYPNMRAILKTIGKCRSRVFSFRAIESQLDELGELFVFREENDILSDWQNFWPIETSRQARLLLWTTLKSFDLLMRSPWETPKPKIVTFFVDRMDFFPDNSLSLSQIPNYPEMFLALNCEIHGIELRVISFRNRPDIPKWIQMYLGLIDGESWLYGRIMREAPLGAQSIDKQALFFNRLNVEERVDYVFDPSVVGAANNEMITRGGNFIKLAARLNIYWKYWNQWLIMNRWASNGIYWGDQIQVYPKPKLVRWYYDD